MRYVEAQGARVAVREWGPAGGEPVFFWHALGPVASGALLAEVAPRLAAAGHRVAAVDGPGFGASAVLPPERYRIPALAELARGVIAALGFERAVVIGHSWGGAIGMRLAGDHPELVRALVLLDSGHIDYRDLPDVDAERTVEAWIEEARGRTLRWESRAAFEEAVSDGAKRITPELVAAYLEGTHAAGGALVGSPAEARGAAMAGLTDRVSTAWPALAAHRVPTLLLLATEPPHGDQNREHLPRFQAAVPDAEVRWVKGAGHGIVSDVGPPLGDEIAAWLGENAR